jgi:hypothetical protein
VKDAMLAAFKEGGEGKGAHMMLMHASAVCWLG